MDRDTLFQTLKRQYNSTYTMLQGAVEACPPELWEDRSEEPPFWQQVFHAAMSMHGCLRDSFPDFDHATHQTLNADIPADTPPEDAFRARVMLGIRLMLKDFAPQHVVSQREMCTYITDLQAKSEEALAQDLDRGLESSHLQVWAGTNLLEKHLYYMRHTQHHIGRLNSMLYRKVGVRNPWVVIERPAFAPPEYKGLTTLRP